MKERKLSIDCTKDCRHFLGSHGQSFNFKCDKGHHNGNPATVRQECEDFAPLAREEKIFRRMEHTAKYHGDRDFRARKAEARRAATALRKALSSFQEVLDDAQIEAIETAAKAVDQLGNDLDRAALLAKRYHIAQTQKRERETQEQNNALVAELLALAPLEAVMADLLSFASEGGTAWLRAQGCNDYYAMPYFLKEALQQKRQVPDQVLRAEFNKAIGQLADELNGGPKLAHFKEWLKKCCAERAEADSIVSAALSRASVTASKPAP